MIRRSFVFAFGLMGFACGDPAGVPDDLEQACRQLIACRQPAPGRVTGAQIEECRQLLSVEYDEAAEVGCADEHADLVSCHALVPLVCSMQGPGSCEEALDRLELCRAD